MTPPVALAAAPETWLAATRAANLLVRQGCRVIWSTTGFSGLSAGRQVTFPQGSFLVVDGALPDAFPGVALVPLDTSPVVAGTVLRPIRIGVYGSGGAPYNHAAAFTAMGFLTEFLFAQDILDGALADIDILAVPGGGARAMFGQLDPLGETGCAAIRDFVAAGGMYLGSCAGAFDASLVGAGFVAACPQQKQLQMINAAVWNSGTAWMGLQSPGVGVLTAAVAAADHPVTCGLPPEIDVTHYNGPLYLLRQGTVGDASDAVGLTRVTGVRPVFTPAENFLGENHPEAGWLVTKAVATQAYNAVAGGFGSGRVVLFGSHPEFGLGLDLDAWGEPSRLMANAGLWHAGSAGIAREERSPPRMAAITAARPWATAATVRTRVDRVAAEARALGARDATGKDWLGPTKAMSTFGVPAPAIWARNLASFDATARRINTALDQLQDLMDQLSQVPASDGVEQAIRFAAPAEWNNDFGYEGVLQQLDRAERMLVAAGTGFDDVLPGLAHAYDLLDRSPFHLAVGSYLSATGVFGNVLLLLQMQRDRLETAMIAGRIGWSALARAQ